MLTAFPDRLIKTFKTWRAFEASRGIVTRISYKTRVRLNEALCTPEDHSPVREQRGHFRDRVCLRPIWWWTLPLLTEFVHALKTPTIYSLALATCCTLGVVHMCYQTSLGRTKVPEPTRLLFEIKLATMLCNSNCYVIQPVSVRIFFSTPHITAAAW